MFLTAVPPQICMGYICTKNEFVVYLQFNFYWVSSIYLATLASVAGLTSQ